MDIPEEMTVDIHANHVEMARFLSSKENGYIRVSNTLLRWIEEVEARENQGISANTVESIRSR